MGGAQWVGGRKLAGAANKFPCQDKIDHRVVKGKGPKSMEVEKL